MAEKRIKAPQFVGFIVSPAGRWLRVLAGLVMMIGGISAGGGWWLLAVVGFVPFIAGTFDLCVAGPALGGPVSGEEMRRALEYQEKRRESDQIRAA